MRLIIKIFSCLFLASGCAHMIAPSGGSKDQSPPKLIKITNSDYKKILFQFDEYIELNKWVENFYISPPLKNSIKKTIDNKILVIEIKDSLIQNITYNLVLNNCIKDLNEGNILDSFNYIFSVSNIFDTLSFSGNLYDSYTLKKLENAWVMLFEKEIPDSLIFKITPNYVAKTNKEGQFHFPNLKNNDYRVFGLTDFDFIYNEQEKIAFYEKIINAEKDSFITLLAFDPKIKIDSTVANTIKNSPDSTKLNLIKPEELIGGSLLLNTSPDPFVIFQLFQNEKLHYSFSFDNSPYKLNKISPGKYRLKCVIDKNRDSEWTSGNWSRKIQPEKVFNYPTEIIIRSNWDLEIDWKLE